MSTNTRVSAQKKSSNQNPKNTIETLKDFSSSMAKNTANTFKDIGSGIFDQIFNNQGFSEDNFDDFDRFSQNWENKTKTKKPKKEFKLFNYQNYYENNLIKNQIKELTQVVKKEIEQIKMADKSLMQEVSDIQNNAINALPEKPGIYHIRFLELLLSILRTVRLKINESRTWLQAMVSKKKKRGSLFASMSKSKGTQYSLSQELSTARSIQ